MIRIYFYDLSESEYENNCQLTYEANVEEFGDGYTIKDFYSDRAGIALEDISDGWYSYEQTNDAGDVERRYVFVEKEEKIDD